MRMGMLADKAASGSSDIQLTLLFDIPDDEGSFQGNKLLSSSYLRCRSDSESHHASRFTHSYFLL